MKSCLFSNRSVSDFSAKPGVFFALLVLTLGWFAPPPEANAQAASAGAIQFAAAPSSGYTPINGFIGFKVSRVGGSAGAVSATCATADGTAKAGVDYTATTQTVSWADGDAVDKTFSVPFINRNLDDGTAVSFTANLSAPTGGATLGTSVTEIETIQYPGTITQPTVEITSPPADVSVVTGSPVALSAAVSDPAGILSAVQFYLNGNPYGQSTSEGPFTLDTTAPAPGTYVLSVTVTDNQGRQNSSSRTVTVLPVDPADPVPATGLYTDLGGRNLAGGSTVVLSAMAASASPDGTPLAKVAFYADNTLIAAFDGAGNPLGGASTGGIGVNRPRFAAASAADDVGGTPAAKGTVFTTPWNIPNLTGLINLLTVATTQGGRSQVSTPTTVQAVAITASSDKPPVAVFQNVFNGARVRTGVTLTVPVDVSDPDGGNTGARLRGGRRTSAVGVPSGTISKMEFYLNQAKVATATQPPFSFAFTPSADGTYVIEAIATDGAGLSGVATPVVVNAVSTSPAVSLSLAGVSGTQGSVVAGHKLKAVVTRADDDLSEPLTVVYKTKGSAVSGVNYKTLAGTVTIPAGAESATFKVRTRDDGTTGGASLLKLKLAASADQVYTLGKPATVKIHILDK